MSHTLSQIAAVLAGVALLTTGFVVFPLSETRSLAKGMGVSLSLAVLAAVLIAAVRNYGS